MLLFKSSVFFLQQNNATSFRHNIRKKEKNHNRFQKQYARRMRSVNFLALGVNKGLVFQEMKFNCDSVNFKSQDTLKKVNRFYLYLWRFFPYSV